MENASLDDFRDDSADSEDTPSGDDTDIDSEVPTSRWDPGGTACAVCGERAARLWHAGDRLVCGSCKDWG
jgi:hypothetical protein